MKPVNISPVTQNNATDNVDHNKAPGMQQDFKSRKALKEAEKNISSIEKWVLVSFFLEFIVFVVIIAAWTSLSQIERLTKEDVLKQQIKRISAEVERSVAALEKKTADVRELERNLPELKKKHDNKVKNFKAVIQQTNTDTTKTKNRIKHLSQKIKEYDETMTNIRKCGKTKRMTQKFNVSKDQNDNGMKCTKGQPCYCYGKLCLVPEKDECGKGNVFVEGKPVCGPGQFFTKHLGKVICQELGFHDVDSVARNREFGKASSLNGWIYMNTGFSKEHCHLPEPGHGEVPSIGNCIGKKSPFASPNKWENWCKQNTKREYSIGVVCS